MRIAMERETLSAVPAVDLVGLRKEMDDFYDIMALFQHSDPSENLMHLYAFTARMSYERAKIIRYGTDRSDANFRTKELDPFISECDRQFKIWSRLITVHQMDWELSRGGK